MTQQTTMQYGVRKLQRWRLPSSLFETIGFVVFRRVQRILAAGNQTKMPRDGKAGESQSLITGSVAEETTEGSARVSKHLFLFLSSLSAVIEVV